MASFDDDLSVPSASNRAVSDRAGHDDTTVTDITATDVRRAAMDLLARREHSFQELSDKLLRRFGPSSLIRPALEQLRQDGLQSDVRFAEAYVHSRAQRLYGPSRIRMELRERRVSEEAIDNALEESGVDWGARLAELIRRKFGRSPPMDITERAKRQRFIAYRGFNHFRLHDDSTFDSQTG